MKQYILSGIVALGVSFGVIWLYPEMVPMDKTLQIEHINTTPVQGAVYTLNEDQEIVPLDFTSVAEKVMDAVVHIRSTQTGNATARQVPPQELPDPFRDFC